MQAWQQAGRPLADELLADVAAVQPQSVLSLEGNAMFLGDRTLGSALWIHPHYPPLLRLLLLHLEAGDVEYLSGTPGVGKTMLGAVLVCLLLYLGFRVVYLTYRLGDPGGYTAFKLELGQPPERTYQLHNWEHLLAEEDKLQVCVVDGGAPPRLLDMWSPTVVLTSPGKGGIRDLRKNPGRKRFWMYTWTRHELEMCRKQLPRYSTLPVDVLQKAYQVQLVRTPVLQVVVLDVVPYPAGKCPCAWMYCLHMWAVLAVCGGRHEGQSSLNSNAGLPMLCRCAAGWLAQYFSPHSANTTWAIKSAMWTMP